MSVHAELNWLHVIGVASIAAMVTFFPSSTLRDVGLAGIVVAYATVLWTVVQKERSS